MQTETKRRTRSETAFFLFRQRPYPLPPGFVPNIIPEAVVEPHKTCQRCKQSLPHSCFFAGKASDGRESRCKRCQNIVRREKKAAKKGEKK